MDEARKQAYDMLLAAALLHLKWDLACALGGLCWFPPWQLISQARSIRMAAHRAYAFHNLAISSTNDFNKFDEEWFWQGIRQFQAKFPEDRHQYQVIFDRCVKGEPVNIVAPEGVRIGSSDVDVD